MNTRLRDAIIDADGTLDAIEPIPRLHLELVGELANKSPRSGGKRLPWCRPRNLNRVQEYPFKTESYGGVTNSQRGPLARVSLRSRVASGAPSASAMAMYQAS